MGIKVFKLKEQNKGNSSGFHFVVYSFISYYFMYFCFVQIFFGCGNYISKKKSKHLKLFDENFQ